MEFDGQALDPAIVAAQPMKPAQTVDMQQMGCPPGECHFIYLCRFYSSVLAVFFDVDILIYDWIPIYDWNHLNIINKGLRLILNA